VRSIFRILIVGSTWAGLEAMVLVWSVLILGTLVTSTNGSDSLVGPSDLLFTPHTFGPLPNLPIGWFMFPIAFGAGFVIRDVAETVKATALSTFVGILAALLFVSFLRIPFPGAVSQGDAQAAYFGILGLPLFLIGMVGGFLGCALGGWIVAALRGRPW
jgi:hypothetical protein